MEQICPINQCTGCAACANVCKKKAISMTEDTIGHIFPHVDIENCVDCGACKKACPAQNMVERQLPQKAYAAWAKDKQEHKTSSSGGAAAIFTNYILKKNGVIYGCVLENGFLHKRITNQQEAYKLKGSKYTQSYIGDTYAQIKQDLAQNKSVLFIGVPCQVAGLKAFLGKNISPNLVTVDLVCHGVPPQKLLFENLKLQGILPETISNISFREKDGLFLTVSSAEKIIYRNSVHKDLYYMAFLDNLTFRESCYSCAYANSARVGDITIADFWGLGRTVPFPKETKDGVSLILTNTEKGAAFLAACEDNLEMFERTVDEAIAGNPNLRRPSFSKNHERFVPLYKKYGFKKALKKCMRIRRIKSVLLRVYGRILK